MYKYKWKPNARQRKEFAEKMKDTIERTAYEERKKAKKLYENWEHNNFVPTKEQYVFCMNNADKVKDDQQVAFANIYYGYGCNEKINHCYIHIVNQLRRGEIEFNNI